MQKLIDVVSYIPNILINWIKEGIANILISAAIWADLRKNGLTTDGRNAFV